MSNLGSKFMNFLKLTDDDEFEDDFYEDDMDYDDRKELEKEEKRLMKERKKEAKRSGNISIDEDSYFDKEPRVSAATTAKRVTPVSSPRQTARKVVQMPASGSDMEVCIMKPTNIDEAQSVCSLLMENHPVVVNLEGIDTIEAQRIMDFICGCVFAIEGNMCQVSRYIFVFSPNEVDISGEYIKDLGSGDYNVEMITKGF